MKKEILSGNKSVHSVSMLMLILVIAILTIFMSGCAKNEKADDDSSVKGDSVPSSNNTSNTIIIEEKTQSEISGASCDDSCKKSDAIAKKDATVCNNIVGAGMKNSCFYEVGLSTKNENTCAKISDLTLRKKCYDAIGYIVPKEDVDIRNTFMSTGKSMCAENGVPIIRLYGASYCPHCRWVAKTFYAVAKEYSDRGLIKAYYWELNGGDDLMTEAVAGEMSEDEKNFYLENNPKGIIPYFNFGCVYERFGNGYEGEDSGLEKEEAEFRQTIDSLIAKLIKQ